MRDPDVGVLVDDAARGCDPAHDRGVQAPERAAVLIVRGGSGVDIERGQEMSRGVGLYTIVGLWCR